MPYSGAITVPDGVVGISLHTTCKALNLDLFSQFMYISEICNYYIAIFIINDFISIIINGP